MQQTFKDLGVSASVVDVLAARSIHEPFPIQTLVLPDALEGLDILARSPTGSGKTLAFALPIIQRHRKDDARPFALVMVPTRELAAQVAQVFRDIAGELGVLSAFGGTPVKRDIEKLRRGVEVVVATPGRLADLYERGELSLDAIRILVLDEADRMLDLGFMYDMDWLIRRLPAERQTMLFSATLNTTVRQLARRYTRDPALIEVDAAEPSVEEIEHHFFLVHPMDKVEVLAKLLVTQPLTLVFTSTKRYAARLGTELKQRDISVVTLHGDMPQAARTKSLQRFSSGAAKVLVASDVAARGLDVTGIEQVINYDPPEDPTVYLHRVGRTARAGATGRAITLCTSTERGHVEHMLARLGLQERIEEVYSTSPVLEELAS